MAVGRCLAAKIAIVLLLLCGCATPQKNTLTQISTIDALLAGAYDGQISSGDLLHYGDFGLGTFDRLDGEMIVLGGTVYQAKSDGKIYTPAPSLSVPFAAVCRFSPDRTFPLDATGYDALCRRVDEAVANPNTFCAVQVRGSFKKVKFRSVPAQAKPYPPLAKAAKNQSVFELQDVSGTIVGFRCPPFVKGVNVPGYHLHFITDDLTRGGHLLDMEMAHGSCLLDVCNRFLMILPENAVQMQSLDLSIDRSKELGKVEK